MTSLESIIKKINSLDLAEPYIWRLRITSSEFEALRNYVVTILESDRRSVIDHYPLLIIAYLAEWYKRCYTGDNADDQIHLSSSELSQLWTASGIDINTYVACKEDGTRRWLYSIYVLGGLALQFEMRRGDEGRFMRKLCRLYHGEDENLSVSDQSAISFRQSIERRQSIFEYIRSIINGEFPFAVEDIESNPLFNDFIKTVIDANLATLVKSDKFDLIRAIRYEPGVPYGRRVLYLRMRPEEVGKGCHGYLRYDRLRAWDIQDPDKVRRLALSLRFYNGSQIIQDVDFDNPVKEWEHTGWRESGMLCNGDEAIICHEAPCCQFDGIEAVIKSSTGEQKSVGRWNYPAYAQMWLKDEEQMLWTDRKMSGRESALFFTGPWHADDTVAPEQIRLLTWRDEVSDYRVMYRALDSVINLSNGTVMVGPFYPSVEGLSLEFRRYDNLIKYEEDGNVRVRCDEEESLLTPIFYKSDILIKCQGGAINNNVTSPDKVEYFSGRAYVEWEDGSEPDYGILRLRITSGSRQWKVEVVYLPPSSNPDEPIIRNFEQRCISYMSDNKEILIEDGNIGELSEQHVCPYIECVAKAGGCEVVLNLFRPVKYRHWTMDNIHGDFIHGEAFTISWLLRDRIVIEELSEQGYVTYACSRLNTNIGLPGALMCNWKEGKYVEAKDLDTEAFLWLRVNYGTPPPSQPGNYVCWDFNPDKRPEMMFVTDADQVKGIAFMDARKSTTPEYGYPIIGESTDDGGWWDEDRIPDIEPSALASFLVVCEYQTYFVMFKPFDDNNIINERSLYEQLIRPLMEHDGGRITECHLVALKRMCEELNFNIDINELRR